MNKNNNKSSFALKRSKPRYIVINENIHEALDLYTLSLYMAFRYEADYAKEDAILKRSADFLYKKAKISRRQFFLSLNILEDLGLVMRDLENSQSSISTYHVAQELHYFNSECLGVQDVHGGVHGMHTDQYIIPLSSNINITTSESVDSSKVATRKKQKPNLALLQLIDVYREVFPDNPQPLKHVISTSLQKTLSTLVKRWPELDKHKNPLTLETFRKYLEMLKRDAPKFSLGAYTTENGNTKKNGLETFARWNTVVKFLENQYS